MPQNGANGALLTVFSFVQINNVAPRQAAMTSAAAWQLHPGSGSAYTISGGEETHLVRVQLKVGLQSLAPSKVERVARRLTNMCCGTRSGAALHYIVAGE